MLSHTCMHTHDQKLLLKMVLHWQNVINIKEYNYVLNTTKWFTNEKWPADKTGKAIVNQQET